MANRSKASAALAAATSPRINLSNLAKQTGISRARLRSLKESGGGGATATEMAKLREALGIPLEDWLVPAGPSGDLPAERAPLDVDSEG